MLNSNIYNKAYLNTIIKESADVEKCQWIADQIGGIYDVETNTIDCKRNRFIFKRQWLNDDGSFDFKLINLNEDCCRMFIDCDNALTHLPEDFTIPQGVTKCNDMFAHCTCLTNLPENFTIPNTVTECNDMFNSCRLLSYLPENFTLPESIISCTKMFAGLIYLQQLPETFNIPNGVENCSWMFWCCYHLERLPENFTIPQTVENCEGMFANCKHLIDLPEHFKIPAASHHEYMFDDCNTLGYPKGDVENYIELEI